MQHVQNGPSNTNSYCGVLEVLLNIIIYLLKIFLYFLGNAISLPLFTRAMKLSDPMILLLTIFMKIVSNIAFGLARTPELFYTGTHVTNQLIL